MRFCRFDPQQQSRRLQDGGAPVAVGARALDVLSALAGAPLGRILPGEAR